MYDDIFTYCYETDTPITIVRFAELVDVSRTTARAILMELVGIGALRQKELSGSTLGFLPSALSYSMKSSSAGVGDVVDHEICTLCGGERIYIYLGTTFKHISKKTYHATGCVVCGDWEIDEVGSRNDNKIPPDVLAKIRALDGTPYRSANARNSGASTSGT